MSIKGSRCVYRLEDTLSPVYCQNEAQPGLGGYCADHARKNPNDPTRCLRMIAPGEPGNEVGTTDLRCEGSRTYRSGPYCDDHQPA